MLALVQSFRIAEIDIGEYGFVKQRAAEIHAVEVCVAEVRADEVCAAKVRCGTERD